jgi:hypothetical protein
MYKVLTQFFDLQDNAKEYHPGDTFPRDGIVVNKARLGELASSHNRLGHAVIEEVKEPSKESEEKPARKRGRQNAD